MHETLEHTYCPPLDPALLSAILSDFDLATPDGLRAARATLDTLKASATAQADTGFDPSGTGARLTVPGGGAHQSESCPGTVETRTEDTELSSLSNGLRSGSDADNPQMDARNASLQELNSASDAEKTTALREMFPDMKPLSITYTLTKSDGDVGRAMDELLNHAFFAQDGEVATRGVDAFSAEEQQGWWGMKKGRRKRRWKGQTVDEGEGRRAASVPSGTARKARSENLWEAGARDVEMIAEVTLLPTALVTSVFYENGASTARALAAICDAPIPSEHQNAKIPDDDAVVRAHAYELGQSFPSIPPSRLAALIRLTHPSTSAAHQLAKLLVAQKDTGGIEIIPQYHPPSTTADSPEWTTVSSPTRSSNTSPRSTDPTTAAAAHSTASSRAFDQASSAYRRGRSDRLMFGAAAYYSQVGRDQAAAATEARGQAADELVDAQSGAGYVDLHGVSVKDAVRIARVRTGRWWKGGGKGVMGIDGRMRRDGENGGALEIVTGIGKHSVGGRGVVGPAVGRMLVGEGWSVKFEEGVVVVTGKRA